MLLPEGDLETGIRRPVPDVPPIDPVSPARRFSSSGTASP